MYEYLNAHLAVAQIQHQIAGARTARAVRELPVGARRRRRAFSLPVLTRRPRAAHRAVGSMG